MDRVRTTMAPASPFAVQLQYDATHRFLHLVVERCVLRNKDDVAAYFAHCSARIRTFELPADMIVRYDQFEVFGEAGREFAGRRDAWVQSIGGRLYRYAAADRSRELLKVSAVPSLPDKTSLLVFESYDAAVTQLLADRGARPRRISSSTLQRRIDDLRSGGGASGAKR